MVDSYFNFNFSRPQPRRILSYRLLLVFSPVYECTPSPILYISTNDRKRLVETKLKADFHIHIYMALDCDT